MSRTSGPPTRARVQEALDWFAHRGNAKVRRDMTTRYGITAAKAYGVSVGQIKQLGKRLGTDQALAEALWRTGWYEARMLAAFVGDPATISAVVMERWTRDVDNWAICDTLCFHLFDRSPHAWRKIGPWSRRKDEFVKRTAFALLASLALHDKAIGDAPFRDGLRQVEHGAADGRNFVKKGVSWALRSIGRRNARLRTAALTLARRLAASEDAAERWVGTDALRDLSKAPGGRRPSTKAKSKATPRRGARRS